MPLRGTLRYSLRAGSCANSLRSDKRPLSRPCVCIRTKPHSTDYNCDVPQCRHPNPHRNIPQQHPYSAQKNKIGCSSPPSPPEGVKGRGGSGGKTKHLPKKNQPTQHPFTTTASFPNAGIQTHTATSLTNTPIQIKAPKSAVQAPLHPGGGEGAGGSGGQHSGGHIKTLYCTL